MGPLGNDIRDESTGHMAKDDQDARGKADAKQAKRRAKRGKAAKGKEKADKRVSRLTKLRTYAHNGVQRTTAALAALALSFAGIMTGVVVSSIRGHQIDFSNNALYTTRFSTSASGLDGRVVAMAENRARTRSLTLIKVDMAAGATSLGLPPQADDYNVYLMALKPNGGVTTWSGEVPELKLIKYGSTGYFAIEAKQKSPFTEQMATIAITSKIASPKASRTKANKADGNTPYKALMSPVYDSFAITVNLAGANAATPEWMDTAGPEELLYNTLVAPSVKATREKIAAQSQTLKDGLKAIETDRRALLDAKAGDLTVTKADLPADIADDTVEGTKLVTKADAPGAWTFDWSAFDGREGFPEDVIPKDQDPSAFIKAKSAEASASQSLPVSSDAWTLSDGRTVTQLMGDSSTGAVAITANIVSQAQSLNQGIAAYRADKTTYQVTLPRAIVDAEAEYLTSVSSITSQGRYRFYTG